MKFWELSHVFVGRDDDHYEAELFEQSLPRYLASRAAFQFWRSATKLMPALGHPRVIDHEDGSWSADWRLRLELWCTYDLDHRGRKVIEQVRVKPRNPDTWWKSGGDLPWTPDASDAAPSGSASAPSGASADSEPPAN